MSRTKPPFIWWPHNPIIRRLWFGLYRLYAKLYYRLTTKYACDGRYILWPDIGLWWDREETDFMPEGWKPRQGGKADDIVVD